MLLRVLVAKTGFVLPRRLKDSKVHEVNLNYLGIHKSNVSFETASMQSKKRKANQLFQVSEANEIQIFINALMIQTQDILKNHLLY